MSEEKTSNEVEMTQNHQIKLITLQEQISRAEDLQKPDIVNIEIAKKLSIDTADSQEFLRAKITETVSELPQNLTLPDALTISLQVMEKFSRKGKMTIAKGKLINRYLSEDRPELACNVYNDCFIAVFDILKELRPEVLNKYMLIPTDSVFAQDVPKGQSASQFHGYITIVSGDKEGVCLTPIDPYWTSSSRLQPNDVSAFDFSQFRSLDSILAYAEAMGFGNLTDRGVVSTYKLSDFITRLEVNEPQYAFLCSQLARRLRDASLQDDGYGLMREKIKDRPIKGEFFATYQRLTLDEYESITKRVAQPDKFLSDKEVAEIPSILKKLDAKFGNFLQKLEQAQPENQSVQTTFSYLDFIVSTLSEGINLDEKYILQVERFLDHLLQSQTENPQRKDRNERHIVANKILRDSLKISNIDPSLIDRLTTLRVKAILLGLKIYPELADKYYSQLKGQEGPIAEKLIS